MPEDQAVAAAVRFRYLTLMHKLCFACLMVMLAGCGDVRQQQPPRVADEPSESALARDSDIQAVEDEAGTEPVEEADAPEPSAEDKKRECCKQCAQGMDKDRTGDPPEKIPCADFTADLDERCRKYFVKSPMTAAEAKSCVAAPPP